MDHFHQNAGTGCGQARGGEEYIVGGVGSLDPTPPRGFHVLQ